MESVAASRLGARLLGEIEEETLDKLLTSLRTSFTIAASDPSGDAPKPTIPTPSHFRSFPIQPLNDFAYRQFCATQSAPLAISGFYLPLLNLLVATLILPPHNKAVLVVDLEWRFNAATLLGRTPWKDEPSRHEQGAGPQQGKRRHQAPGLGAEEAVSAEEPPPPIRPTDDASHVVNKADLQHVYIYRPARPSSSHASDAVAAAEHFMMYEAHGSRSREWWGTIVIGGGLSQFARSGASSWSTILPLPFSSVTRVTAAWSGWLRVDREPVPNSRADTSVEEALAEQEQHQQRQATVDATGWIASCAWGSFAFGRRMQQ